MLLLTAFLAVGCAIAVNRPVPDGYETSVESARSSLIFEWEGAVTPTFAFEAIRCRADGGLVILFDQVGMLGSDGLAVAMSGRPDAGPGDWAGGFAAVDPEKDAEIAAFFAEDAEVPCGT